METTVAAVVVTVGRLRRLNFELLFAVTGAHEFVATSRSFSTARPSLSLFAHDSVYFYLLFMLQRASPSGVR